MKIKKEAIMATVIGLLIGLVITGGILRAQRAMTNNNSTQEEVKTTTSSPSSSTISSNNLTLEISEPEDNLVVSENSINITGTTKPDTYIAIIAEKNEYLIVPNEIGQFTQEITLISGANTITVTVYEEDGNKVETTLNIVYTSAEI